MGKVMSNHADDSVRSGGGLRTGKEALAAGGRRAASAGGPAGGAGKGVNKQCEDAGMLPAQAGRPGDQGWAGQWTSE